jgi:hypothetical protein
MHINQKIATQEFLTAYPQYKEVSDYINKICSDPALTPENVAKQGTYKKLLELSDLDRQHFYNSIDNDGEFIYINSARFCYDDENINGKIDCRFYLNLKAENIAKFCKLLTERAISENLPSNYKFTFRDNRCDTVVIYTKYENRHCQKTLDIINSIKTNCPQLFTGAEKLPRHWGIIDGNIGFGEEPKQKRESYSSVRSDAITEIVSETNKKIKQVLRKKSCRKSKSCIEAVGRNL